MERLNGKTKVKSFTINQLMEQLTDINSLLNVFQNDACDKESLETPQCIFSTQIPLECQDSKSNEEEQPIKTQGGDTSSADDAYTDEEYGDVHLRFDDLSRIFGEIENDPSRRKYFILVPKRKYGHKKYMHYDLTITTDDEGLQTDEFRILSAGGMLWFRDQILIQHKTFAQFKKEYIRFVETAKTPVINHLRIWKVMQIYSTASKRLSELKVMNKIRSNELSIESSFQAVFLEFGRLRRVLHHESILKLNDLPPMELNYYVEHCGSSIMKYANSLSSRFEIIADLLATRYRNLCWINGKVTEDFCECQHNESDLNLEVDQTQGSKRENWIDRSTVLSVDEHVGREKSRFRNMPEHGSNPDCDNVRCLDNMRNRQKKYLKDDRFMEQGTFLTELLNNLERCVRYVDNALSETLLCVARTTASDLLTQIILRFDEKRLPIELSRLFLSRTGENLEEVRRINKASRTNVVNKVQSKESMSKSENILENETIKNTVVPLIKVQVKLINGKLVWNPSKNYFVATVKEALEVIFDVLSNVPSLSYSLLFKHLLSKSLIATASTRDGKMMILSAKSLDNDLEFNSVAYHCVEKAQEAFEHMLKQVELLRILEVFDGLYDSFDESLLKDHEKDIDWLSGELRSCLLQKVILTDLRPWVSFGLFHIDLTSLKESLLSKNQEYYSRTSSFLASATISHCEKTHTMLSNVLLQLESPLITTKEYVDLIVAHEKFIESVDSVQDDCEIADRMVELVKHYNIHEFSDVERSIIENIAKILVRCFNASDSCSANKLEMRTNALKLVLEDVNQLSENVEIFARDLYGAHLLDGVLTDENAVDALQVLESSLNNLTDQHNIIVRHQKALKVEVSPFLELEELNDEFNAIKMLYEIKPQVGILHDLLYKTPISKLPIEQFTSDISKIERNLLAAERKLQVNVIVGSIHSELEKINNKMPLVICMRNPNLTPQHLAQIFTLLGVQDANLDKLTVSALEEIDAFSNTEKVVEITNLANSEASIEELLNKIRQTWENMKLPMVLKGVGPLPALLGDIEDLNQVVEDSVVNIAAILSSKYVGRYRQNAAKWQNDLSALRDALDALSSLQRDYLFLEKIFNSSDIRRELVNEANHFNVAEGVLVGVVRNLTKYPLALDLIEARGIIDNLDRGIKSIQVVKSGLSEFLESKRRLFPRFYFLSDQELIEIQSNSNDPIFMLDYIRKCFDGIQSLIFKEGPNNKMQVMAMISPEKEAIGIEKFFANDTVEIWLQKLEVNMQKAVADATIKAISAYRGSNLLEWINKHSHQAILNASYIFWTTKITEILVNGPSEYLEKYEQSLSSELTNLAFIARQNLDATSRLTVRALITIKVHARDIVAELNKRSVSVVSDFEWTKQLRYYLNELKLRIEMANASFSYANEYLGCAERLVITPLTDRCYLCLTGATQVHLGGAPAGPAGTGKTETTKDLAKALGKPCFVFNCSESMDYKLMGKLFNGMVQTGTWCCFDEFNRINVEVLSVIAQQLMTIREAKRSDLTEMVFNGRRVPLISSCAAFVTMNPGYAGRTELPDNLKMLFRPIAMMVPDYKSIAEVILYSEGFEESTMLSNKMVLMNKLCSEQLSKQDHYDFGMRAIKSILVMAGQLKRQRPNESEVITLIKALYDSNIPKFLSTDAELFKAIVRDLFPLIGAKDDQSQLLQTKVKEAMDSKSMIYTNSFGEKVSQLMSTLKVRHGVMVVGAAGSGKSSVCEILADSCDLISKESDITDVLPVKMFHVNPKSITIDELYGCFDKHTLEWKEGLLGKVVKKCINFKRLSNHWIICDGPVDALWIENLNTVLDDNKMLCLPNSDRIKFTDHMRMIFEVLDLRSASPATVSRCGMVYMDETVVGWRPYFQRWCKSIASMVPEDLIKLLNDFFEMYVDDALDMVIASNHELQQQGRFGKVTTLCSMLESLIYNRGKALSIYSDKGFLCNAFVFCYFWAMAGNGTVADWEEFDIFAKEQFDRSAHIQVPPFVMLYKCYVNPEAGIFEEWDDIVPELKLRGYISAIEMFVPNIDSTRFGYISKMLLKNSSNVLLSGETGVGKSVILKQSCKELSINEDFGNILINFSTRTESASFQSALIAKINRERKSARMSSLVIDMDKPKSSISSTDLNGNVLAGKRTIVTIDDLNVPKPDTFGTQSAIELMRQCIDRKGIYQRDKFNWIPLNEISFSATCGPSGGGRSILCPRLLRTMTILNVPQQSEFDMKILFKTIARRYFTDASAQFIDNIGIIVDISVEFYLKLIKTFRPTPVKSHYLFNLRDLSRTVQGICQIQTDEVWTRENLLDVMIHETCRVFGDRLLDESEVQSFYSLLEATIFEVNRKAHDVNKLIERPLLFCDVSGYELGRNTSKYERIDDLEKLKKRLALIQDTFLQKTNSKNRIIFFKSAVVHFVRIARILKQERGNGLIIGMSGVGKRSLVRLACFMYNMECVEIKLSRGYGIENFRQELKQLFRTAGGENEPCVLLISDDQLINDQFLEDINGFLNNGEIANLWERPGELEQILISTNRTLKDLQRSEDTYEMMYEEFMLRVRRNLHIVLCMSHLSDKFRIRCRLFNSIATCTTIDYISEWDNDALINVAQTFLDEDNDIRLQPELMEKLRRLSVRFHVSAKQLGEEMSEKEGRQYFATSSTYVQFLKSFLVRKQKRQKYLKDEQQRYTNGIKRLEDTNLLVKRMNAELLVLEPKLNEQRAKSEEMQREISSEQFRITALTEKVAAANKQAEQKAKEVGIIRDEVNNELRKMSPIISKATKALDSLNKDDIISVGSYAKPPNRIRKMMGAICLLFNEDNDWNSARRLLNSKEFIKRLRDIEKKILEKPPSMFRALKVYIEDPEFTPEQMQLSSTACKSLCEWVIALYEYRKVRIKVAPVEDNYKMLQKEYLRTTEDVNEKRAELDQLHEKIEILKAKAEKTEKDRQAISEEMQLTKAKIHRSQQLAVALVSESVRWGERRDELQVLLDNNIGDSLLSSACLNYQGPFSNEYRLQMFSNWTNECTKEQLVLSEDVFEGYVSDPSVFLEWKQHGLPDDPFSIRSAVILLHCARWALCLDPQSQAFQWMRNSTRNYRHVSHKDPGLIKEVELSVSLGSTLLITDIDGDIDSCLIKVIEKELIQKAGRTTIMIGDNEVQYHPNFKLYMFTNLTNPSYTPEHYSKCNVVNFEVTLSGLIDQLLGEIIHIEEPLVEQSRNKGLIYGQSLRRQLTESESEILNLITLSGDNILDDDTVVNSLKKAKEKANEANRGFLELAQSEKVFEQTRKRFRKVAMMGSMIYFALNTLQVLDPMYSWSLEYFLKIFRNVTSKGKSTVELEHKLKMLIEELIRDVYKIIGWSLFEKDRQLLSFVLCVQLKRLMGDMDENMLDDILSDTIEPVENEAMSAILLKKAKYLTKYNSFKSLPELILKNPLIVSLTDQNDIQLNSNIEHTFPGSTSQLKLNALEKLVLVKEFVPRFLPQATAAFIKESFGPELNKTAQDDLMEVYNKSSNQVPLLIVLCPGSDPLKSFNMLSRSCGMEEKSQFVSLGQGQGPKAEKLISNATRSGHWVFLQNCHLAPSWMDSLEIIFNDISSATIVHKNFRLFLSTLPTMAFPRNILSNSIKVIFEPAKGIRANVRRCLEIDTNNVVNEFRLKSSRFGYQAVAALSFFHAAILGRKKFGPRGWNIPYEFNDSDFDYALNSLRFYCNNNEFDWRALNYMIGEITYGGRVTDFWDLRCLRATLRRIFSNKIASNEYLFSKSGIYHVAKCIDQLTTKTYINQLPANDSSDIFGLHPITDELVQKMEGIEFTESLRLCFRQSVRSTKIRSTDVNILDLCKWILIMLPINDLNLDSAPQWMFEKDKEGQINSLSTLLEHEIFRYNKLVEFLRESTTNIMSAINGLVVMDEQTNLDYNRFLVNKLPDSWNKISYPTTNSLRAYITNLKARLSFMEAWISQGNPKSFWLPGLYFTQGFLTAVLQIHARQNMLPIDQLKFKFNFTNIYIDQQEYVEAIMEALDEETKFDMILPNITSGILIHGLYSDCFQFSQETLKMSEPQGTSLTHKLPVIHLEPVSLLTNDPIKMYSCPLYRTSVRSGILSTTGHSTNYVMTVDIPTDKDDDFWTEMGCAILCHPSE